MKDERAVIRQPDFSVPRTDKRGEVLKRISLAILENAPSPLANERGSDPYNTTSGRTRSELWEKQRHKR